MSTNTEKMSYGTEAAVGHVNDDSTREAIDTAVMEAFDNIEAMGYDAESANALRSMQASASYGASDLEEKLKDDSPAHAMLAEGYHVALFENEAGQTMLNYSTIQEAVNDVAQALGKMEYIDQAARNDAHGRFADALMRREIAAMDSTLANWSQTTGETSEIVALTTRFEMTAHQHRETMIALMGEITAAREATRELEAHSENMSQLTAAHAKEVQLTEFMCQIQTEWYAFSASALVNIERRNTPDEPQAVREALSEINYNLNEILPEHTVAAYAVEEAGIMDAVDYLRDHAHHDMSSALLDGRLTTEAAVDLALNIDEMPQAMAQVHYGGATGQLPVVAEGDETAAIYGATDEATLERIQEAVATRGTAALTSPADASQYQTMRDQAVELLEEAINTGDVRAIMDSIYQIQEMPAITAMQATRNQAESTR